MILDRLDLFDVLRVQSQISLKLMEALVKIEGYVRYTGGTDGTLRYYRSVLCWTIGLTRRAFGLSTTQRGTSPKKRRSSWKDNSLRNRFGNLETFFRACSPMRRIVD